MSKITDLQDQVDVLQQAVDAEQTQIALLLEGQQSTISQLEAVIADLEAQVAELGSPAELQEVLDQVKAIKADVESTVADTSTSTTTEVS